MALETVPFDSARYLTDQAELIAEASASGDGDVIRNALNLIARPRGMGRVTSDAGVTREGAYKALAPDGDPKLSTILALLGALGVRLSATLEPAGAQPAG